MTHGPEHHNTDSAITHTMGALFAWLGSLQGEDVLIWVSIAVMCGRGVYDLVRFVHYIGDRKNDKQE